MLIRQKLGGWGMNSETRGLVRLAECATFQEGYVNPSQRDPSYFGDDVKWLRATDLNNGFVFETGRRLSKKGFESAGKSATLFAPGTLAISKSGTIGRIGILQDYMCGNRAVINIKPNATCDTRFVFYTLLHRRPEIETLAEGSVQKNLYVSTLGNLKIALPSLVEQKAIGSQLGALDDRITLLRETNATLEAIAQALFKSWFVDFDPVRAKMEGRAPEGMDEATAALFPDALEESELGWVPKGWHHSRLADICTYLSRGLSPKYIEHGGVLVLNQKCIRDFSVDYAKGRRHDPALRKIDGRELAIGDVLVNSTGVGTLGRVAQVLELPEQAVVDSHVTVVRAGAALSWPYLGQWMAKKQPEIETMGEGSTGQTELSRAKLGELMVLVPSKQALVAFDSVVEPLKNRVSLNERTAQTLATLRDTLLPRLISGQLRLPEAQALVAAV